MRDFAHASGVPYNNAGQCSNTGCAASRRQAGRADDRRINETADAWRPCPRATRCCRRFAHHHGRDVEIAPPQHLERRQGMADRAEIAPATRSTGMRSAPSRSSTVWRSSSGTMTPPMPSISSTPRRAPWRDGRTRPAPRSRSRGPRARRRCRGESGACKTPGRDAIDLLQRHGRPSAASRTAGSLVLPVRSDRSR